MTNSDVQRAKWHREKPGAPQHGAVGHADSCSRHTARVPLLAKARERAERTAIVGAAIGGLIFVHYVSRAPDSLIAPLVSVPVVCGYFFLRLYRARDAESKNFEKLYHLHRQRDDNPT